MQTQNKQKTGLLESCYPIFATKTTRIYCTTQSLEFNREIEFIKTPAAYFKFCGHDCLLLPKCDCLRNLVMIS